MPVFVDGELWSARATDGALSVGDEVRVTALDGLELEVEPAPGSTQEGTEP